MNGAQDLGGMMGFGPVAPEPNEPVFHRDWERRAFAVTLAAAACGLWTLDEGRHARESLPPAQYLSKSYYDVWITALAKLAERHGLASAEEIATGRMSLPAREVRAKLRAQDVGRGLAKGAPTDRPAPGPARFSVGDHVKTRVINPTTHTRLPRYARGKRGVVEAVRGAFVFPDSNAHGRGEDPRWLYTVRFDGAELWGADADPSTQVSIDAWEPYLEPA